MRCSLDRVPRTRNGITAGLGHLAVAHKDDFHRPLPVADVWKRNVRQKAAFSVLLTVYLRHIRAVYAHSGILQLLPVFIRPLEIDLLHRAGPILKVCPSLDLNVTVNNADSDIKIGKIVLGVKKNKVLVFNRETEERVF